MIVRVTLPAGKTGLNYGAVKLGVDVGATDVPDYVAKTLVAAGAASPSNLSASTSSMLVGSADWELQYMIMGHGQSTGNDPYAPGVPYNRKNHAISLYAEKGDPTVTFE